MLIKIRFIGFLVCSYLFCSSFAAAPLNVSEERFSDETNENTTLLVTTGKKQYTCQTLFKKATLEGVVLAGATLSSFPYAFLADDFGDRYNLPKLGKLLEVGSFVGNIILFRQVLKSIKLSDYQCPQKLSDQSQSRYLANLLIGGVKQLSALITAIPLAYVNHVECSNRNYNQDFTYFMDACVLLSSYLLYYQGSNRFESSLGQSYASLSLPEDLKEKYSFYKKAYDYFLIADAATVYAAHEDLSSEAFVDNLKDYFAQNAAPPVYENIKLATKVFLSFIFTGGMGGVYLVEIGYKTLNDSLNDLNKAINPSNQTIPPRAVTGLSIFGSAAVTLGASALQIKATYDTVGILLDRLQNLVSNSPMYPVTPGQGTYFYEKFIPLGVSLTSLVLAACIAIPRAQVCSDFLGNDAFATTVAASIAVATFGIYFWFIEKFFDTLRSHGSFRMNILDFIQSKITSIKEGVV